MKKAKPATPSSKKPTPRSSKTAAKSSESAAKKKPAAKKAAGGEKKAASPKKTPAKKATPEKKATPAKKATPVKKATPTKKATPAKATPKKKPAAGATKTPAKAKATPAKPAAKTKTAAAKPAKTAKQATAKTTKAKAQKEDKPVRKAATKPTAVKTEKKPARKAAEKPVVTPTPPSDESAPTKPKRGRPRKADQEAAAAKQAQQSADGPPMELESKEAAPKKKAKRAGRKRRTRALPRVPDTIRAYPAWAEAWTALAETGLEAYIIPAVLRDASLIFNGLGELSSKSADQLAQFWEIKDAPAGIESILEEAFLAQPPQPERKQQIEAFFKEVMAKGDVHDALIFLWTARHVPDWAQASATLASTDSPFHDDGTLFAIAREIVG